MRTLNIYSFHRNIAPQRFDAHNTQTLRMLLSSRYNINWHNLDGQDKFVYKNDCNVLIDQGSILIFEFDDTKEFKTFDFGDAPTLTMQLSKSKNFIGAAIGQYNPHVWKDFPNVKPSVYPESYWNLGIENFRTISEWRSQANLDTRLHWRGSIYKNPSQSNYYNIRETIEHMAADTSFSPRFHFGNTPLPFDQYIQEAVGFRLVLCFGGGGGYLSGDFCFRDIEMYGLGIPTIRPQYVTQTQEALVPNVHYVSVDCEFDDQFRYKDPKTLASKIIKRYKEVIDDVNFLNEISYNAQEWYLRNAVGPTITEQIIKSLGL